MILYHGSETIINDRVMASGTYFTADITVAQEYGDIIYSIDCDNELLKIFKKDFFNEHYINGYSIPLYMFALSEIKENAILSKSIELVRNFALKMNHHPGGTLDIYLTELQSIITTQTTASN